MSNDDMERHDNTAECTDDSCKCSMSRRDVLKLLAVGSFAYGALLNDGSIATAGDVPDSSSLTANAVRSTDAYDTRLFARGERRVYEADSLGAISLCIGGIAAGPIQINGKAKRHIWQIAKNFKAIALPHSFFAVRARQKDRSTDVRVLQTEDEGPFKAMQSLKFSGEYPFGWYTFTDETLPIEVKIECFSPLIPLNEKDSAIPCAIFNLSAHNPTQTPVEVSFLATQQNAIGMNPEQPITGRLSKGYGGNITKVIREHGNTTLHMTSTRPNDAIEHGDMALTAMSKHASVNTAWDSIEDLLKAFTETGMVTGAATAGPTLPGETVDGALTTPFILAPGETHTVTFVLTWHFPNVQPPMAHRGNMYTNWWADALQVSRYVTAKFNHLSEQTHLYNETLYATNLPYWLVDRISSQMAILSSMTCCWAQDGHFYAWEGCGMAFGCCIGNATHVWGYAQSHARLFPAVGRAMREADAHNVTAEGMLPVRFGVEFPAFDGQCAFIMSSFREHLVSTDGTWLHHNWPIIKRAMDYTIARWDSSTPSDVEFALKGVPDGMLAGPQHAMDGDQGGTCSWLGSMYLGALSAASKMAAVEGDKASAARYLQILQAGSVNQDKALFNGEYYIQIPDSTPRHDYLTGCYIDQLLGQWWTKQIDSGWLYPLEHVQSAMKSLFKYNFHTSLASLQQQPRRFAADTDAGMQQGTWPKGGKPAAPNVIYYTDELMSGFEYSAASLMIYAGLMKEGFTVLRAVADRYDGRLRTGLTEGDTTSWGYSGNPFGDDECGKFYARSMAIWSILLACQGFVYDGPAAKIGFNPVWKPEEHSSFFTASEGWGLFRQSRDGQLQQESINLKWGKLRIATMIFEVSSQTKVKEMTMTVNKRKTRCRFTQEGQRVTVTLEHTLILGKDGSLEVRLT